MSKRNLGFSVMKPKKPPCNDISGLAILDSASKTCLQSLWCAVWSFASVCPTTSYCQTLWVYRSWIPRVNQKACILIVIETQQGFGSGPSLLVFLHLAVTVSINNKILWRQREAEENKCWLKSSKWSPSDHPEALAVLQSTA